ncbi:hypothetical protein NIIDMKKI_08260 [Mycobacterium kansasii]|uniref:Enoyl-CoA hydratase/isomerase family protein n=1 Tax=Mycobacterium kansasii TaxID=1768 RepID=A0A7G1I3M7_MYCKA|nr:hypothetical protein NIIDMKKI_08260 [Mycobacterium kansasii]
MIWGSGRPGAADNFTSAVNLVAALCEYENYVIILAQPLPGSTPSSGSDVTETLVKETPRSGVVVIRLNRPERLNAINDAMLAEFTRTFASLAADASVKAVVLTGAGRGFCSGIDVRDFGAGAPDAGDPAIDRMRFQEAMASIPRAIRDLPQPVIAAVNGPCVGAGLALCLAADIRICSAAATFGNAAILWGCRGPRWG